MARLAILIYTKASAQAEMPWRNTMEEITESAILDKMLEPVTRCLTPAVAKRITELRADPVTQARIDELAAKCNEGALTEAERREYGAYIDAIDLIGILQVKARVFLSSAPHS
jgi:hypothetical protein